MIWASCSEVVRWCCSHGTWYCGGSSVRIWDEEVSVTKEEGASSKPALSEDPDAEDVGMAKTEVGRVKKPSSTREETRMREKTRRDLR
ncbi:hypothetical protein BGZ54_004318, partial [Gamsiella multidivaricata]